jgi:hypothetical protein
MRKIIMTQRNKKVGGEEARQLSRENQKEKGKKGIKKMSSVFLSTFFAVERRKRF